MEFYQIEPGRLIVEELVKKNFCYLPSEIKAELVSSQLDLVIVPVVAFGDSKKRIGFGKGFYDRFFSKLSSPEKLVKVGFAYDEQNSKDLNQNPNSIFEAHDFPLDFIITPTQVYE